MRNLLDSAINNLNMDSGHDEVLIQRSGSEFLNQKVIPCFYFDLVFSILKLCLSALCMVTYILSSYCGEMMSQLLLGSFITMAADALIFFNFVFFVKKPPNCIKHALSAYCAISYCIVTWFILCFQLAWGIVCVVIYIEYNSCDQDLNFTDSVALVVVIYFMANIFRLLCSCTLKVCACVSTFVATSKTDS
ncbi:unnamed protein product [Blepharisma stoltei]|uniref:Uncharacterized protein n=1 Tax=Blepharisma stoltei TaxID=1481888 RepID=A0AAU9JU99_9CILI|nr:unnamed protein product [Blepharisma stoltei]